MYMIHVNAPNLYNSTHEFKYNKRIKSLVNKVKFEPTPMYPIHQNTIGSFRIEKMITYSWAWYSCPNTVDACFNSVTK